MALGEPLPKQIFGHPWFNFGNDKMSKSKGNVIYADELAAVFGTDGLRHYALSEMPYANDGSITHEAVVERYNNDLANNLGNLVSRTAAMTEKYFGSVIPVPAEEEPLDKELKQAAHDAFKKMFSKMEALHCAEAIEEIFAFFRRTNKYIDETAPWILAKSEETKPRLQTVLYNLLEAVRFGAVMLAPYLPETSEKILSILNTEKNDFASLKEFGALTSGVKLGKAENLFARVDKEKYLQSVAEKAEQNKPETKKPEGVAKIGIDDFMKVELRTAQVTACEKVKRSEKLLKLQVDLGYETRQVVSGIAKFYQPEDLIGKKLIIVANLLPAKLCGEESNGMILASGEDKVKVVFLSEDTPLGQRVR